MTISAPDLAITVAYFSIPVQIVIGLCKYPRVTRRATKKVVVLLILFALFIFLCGTGHLLRCIDAADTPLFRATNILTAVVSITTAIYLMPFVPNLLDGADKLYLEATTSKEIIKKMYPAVIRERLLNHESSRLDASFKEMEMMNKERCNGKRSSNSLAIRRSIQDFIRRRNGEKVERNIGETLRLEDDEPIADEFENTSIMFADISNFTYWSSQHSPSEVFTLLEFIFFEFDRIAKEMDVYKLSTVGDCYIACTGVPYPCDDHAILLVEFAQRCLQASEVVLNRVNSQLNTKDLSIRIGVHSGHVTAGVLRGDKARFDLFGDTINTAQRIESTGKPNSIHLSEQTAQLIKEGGKSEWLLPRKDAVKAKGKGQLRTYWLRGVDIEDSLSSADEEAEVMDEKYCDDDMV